MKEKVLQLEAKVDRLETKVEEQEALLIDLQRQTSAKLAAGKTGSDPLAERNFETYRTCSEAIAYDPSLPSGMYLIDPDINCIGDGPINVYCDMVKGIR